MRNVIIPHSEVLEYGQLTQTQKDMLFSQVDQEYFDELDRQWELFLDCFDRSMNDGE